VRFVVLLLLLIPALCASAYAAQFHSLKVSRDGDTYHLSADVYLDAPPPQVYRVLTDYNHLTRISGAIRRSRLLHRSDTHTALVYVESRACVLFFCHTIKETQKVVETPPGDLTAEAIPAQSNVQRAESTWHLQAEGAGTRMQWNLTIVPEFWIPPLIGPALVEGELRDEAQYSAGGIEKLARQWAHLPPLSATSHAPSAQTH
jgi:hypothetical protein